MKRSLAYLLAFTLAICSAIPTAHSAVTPGTKCTKAGIQKVYKDKIYTCIKLGSKLYWNNGAIYRIVKATPSATPSATQSTPSNICDPSGICKVGMVGPGGGIVFYDAGGSKEWGRYLEYASEGWLVTGTEPTALWCIGDKSKNFSSLGLQMIIGSVFHTLTVIVRIRNLEHILH